MFFLNVPEPLKVRVPSMCLGSAVLHTHINDILQNIKVRQDLSSFDIYTFLEFQDCAG